MLSKVQIKSIRALHQKKNRQSDRLFLVEGEKLVSELLESNYEIKAIYATNDWQNTSEHSVTRISNEELEQISTLQTPNKVLAIVHIPQFELNCEKANLELYLDDIKDPGNMGTIIRTAEWFGLNRIFCSENSVEIYSPKTVQSSMGSIFRVEVHRFDFDALIELIEPQQLLAATLDGLPLKNSTISAQSMLIIGSESHGISNSILSKVNSKVKIEQFGQAESLNASVACGILLYEIKHALL